MGRRIVVDVGCKSHEAERSIEPLIERFKPNVIYGFDPHPQTQPGTYTEGDTLVVITREAAWAYDGMVGYVVDGASSRLDGERGVRCFDFAAWLGGLLAEEPDAEVILKLDCEGAEFELLARLRERGLLEGLARVLVEWHFPCPVERW